MINWHIKRFNELTSSELYKILQLRINVFMLEQNCLYPECDDKDLKANHLFAIDDNKVIAYARLLPPGISYKDTSIGRVVVDKSFRGKNIGAELINRSIDKVFKAYPDYDIRISAQAHLQKFYTDLGFIATDKTYLEDNIPHIEMYIKNKKS